MIPNPIVVDMGITEPQTIPMSVSECGGAIPMGISMTITPIAGADRNNESTPLRREKGRSQ